MSENWNKGEFVSLARLAREKREQNEYTLTLRAVIIHCKDAERRMRHEKQFALTTPRQKIWEHITGAIDLAEQELKRLGVEV